MDTGCGEFVYKNIMGESEMKTDEMLAINPWHQIPSMSDGELGLGESGAILRYIANKYAPELYGSDAESKAVRLVRRRRSRRGSRQPRRLSACVRLPPSRCVISCLKAEPVPADP